MEIARDQGRKTRPDIKLGICGEHGGDPESVKFCHRIGLDYVSCSPFRIPVARLAAAQAALEKKCVTAFGRIGVSACDRAIRRSVARTAMADMGASGHGMAKH